RFALPSPLLTGGVFRATVSVNSVLLKIPRCVHAVYLRTIVPVSEMRMVARRETHVGRARKPREAQGCEFRRQVHRPRVRLVGATVRTGCSTTPSEVSRW